MGRLYVCPLAHVEKTVAETRAGALVSILTPPAAMARPQTIAAENHLRLGLADVVAPQEGFALAREDQIAELIAFVRRWDFSAPLLIHCLAGVSRSPAAAFIALCALTGRDERDIARELRRRAPSVTPNRHLVALADTLLSRGGRMSQAIQAIGRGADCFEGEIFHMETE